MSRLISPGMIGQKVSVSLSRYKYLHLDKTGQGIEPCPVLSENVRINSDIYPFLSVFVRSLETQYQTPDCET